MLTYTYTPYTSLQATENLMAAWKSKAAPQLKHEQEEYKAQQEQQLRIHGILQGSVHPSSPYGSPGSSGSPAHAQGVRYR